MALLLPILVEMGGIAGTISAAVLAAMAVHRCYKVLRYAIS